MARSISAEMIEQVSSKIVRPIIFVKLDFKTEPLYMWSGLGLIDWNGVQWTGAGTLLTISSIEETVEVRATGLELGLTGVPSSLISVALTEDYQERPVTIWLGVFDEDLNIVTSPLVIFQGRMDVMRHQDNENTADFVLSAENRLIDLQRVTQIRFTKEEQRDRYPGDTFFDYTAQLVEKSIILRDRKS